jgi:hypothetical protein
MNGGCSGLFTRLSDDNCAYQQYVAQSIKPANHKLYIGQYEHCGKCVKDKNSFYHPFDVPIVDAENELTGRTRRHTLCSNKKYTPTCKKCKTCMSTYDPSVPVVLPGEVCPIVTSGIKRMTTPGFGAPESIGCNIVPRVPQNGNNY